MENFKLPSWSARNPLGIVALFISLIYGMSALLLGTSVNALSSTNQTILVVFIAAFPFVVLGVFGWLVAWHHMKLYGPSDYRTDKSFLDAVATLPPSEVSKKLRLEIAESEQPTISDHDPEPRAMSVGSGKSMTVGQAFLLEGVVFQALQRDFRASVRRNVRLPDGKELDGIMELIDGTVIAVEVKFVRKETKNFAGMFYQAEKRASSIANSLLQMGSNKFSIVLALVYDGDVGEMRTMQKMLDLHRGKFAPNVELRLYSLRTLLEEFKLSEDSEQLAG